MSKLSRFFLGALAIAFAAVAFAGAVPATINAANLSDVVGHVYINDNNAGPNTVAAYYRYADGSLAPVPGSPFVVGGAGAGSVVGSAGAIQLSDDGRFVIAVDAGSNQISVARIRPDGGLVAVDSPVSSGGLLPVSITVHGGLIYVANAGAGGQNYTGFWLDRDGHLSAIDGSTYWLPDNANPGQVLFSPDGKYLIGTRVGPDAGPSYIDSFVVDDGGRLNAVAGSPMNAQRIGPFGSAFRPTNASQLYVSNAHDGANAGNISAYEVTNGRLSALPGSPFADQQTAPCWVEISHDGRYLYAVNTGVSTISSFSIAVDGTLSLIGSTPMSMATGLRPFDVRLDPSGKYLYVVDAGLGAISEFKVDGGTLTELTSSPMPAPMNAHPFGIAVN